ncbi:MAG: hypothetical protein HOE90_03200 [Bacteriovoracaceae bacterium]|jgi:two-component system, cell cycle sensor histidine kinase and response regulator CckA|nr:hypothetical protein [Bacteriovoracaceae bacterium]
MALKYVKVPTPFAPLFEEAEKYVIGYFSKLNLNPEKGVIEIDGERYILVRSASMSVHFLEFITQMYPALDKEEAISASAKVLFDIAHSMGIADAKEFHTRTNVTDPISKLSTGPVHFAFTGWASVDIHPDSTPSPDENFCLIYDHPQSFEADAWISKRKKVNFCTCFMNSGYSSGWCEQSFDIPLVAQEITCRSRGDQYCRFIMSQAHRIDEFIEKYLASNPEFKK